MPKTLKKPPVKPTVVTNRNAAIKQARMAGAPPDLRDQVHSAPPATTPKQTTSLDISRAPQRGQAQELAQQLMRVRVTDKASYMQAKEIYGAGKQIKRQITEHWQRVTRSVDALKQSIFGFRDDDLSAIEPGLQHAERVIIDFENAEAERVRAEENRLREERERKARQDRERELEAAEDQALELEQKSADLSPRELWFVTKVVEQNIDTASTARVELKAMLAIAAQAGFKKGDVDVARLLRSKKVLDAIQATRDARAIREQAQAQREQPLELVDAPPVESQVARGRGLPPTKTYYSCEVVDANKLREAFLNGELAAEALIPNEVYLNAQARAAKSAAIFERAFPGCRLKTRQSI